MEDTPPNPSRANLASPKSRHTSPRIGATNVGTSVSRRDQEVSTLLCLFSYGTKRQGVSRLHKRFDSNSGEPAMFERTACIGRAYGLARKVADSI